MSTYLFVNKFSVFLFLLRWVYIHVFLLLSTWVIVHINLCTYELVSTESYLLLLIWVYISSCPNFFFFLRVLVTRIHIHVLWYQNREICPHLDIHVHISMSKHFYIFVEIYKIDILKWMWNCREKNYTLL